MPMPTLPREENLATSLLELVMPCQGLFVLQLPPTQTSQRNTSLVMSLGSSPAPTLITFFPTAGERMLSLSPPNPSSPPFPLLPAAKTYTNDCDPVAPGKESRTAWS